MRSRIRIALISVVLGLAMAVPAVAWAATPEDVSGVWTSVDIDGSNQVMFVNVDSSNRARILLLDDAGTVCDGAPLVALGRGTLAGNELSMRFRIFCANGIRPPVSPFSFELTAPDTLVDDLGVVWSRL